MCEGVWRRSSARTHTHCASSLLYGRAREEEESGGGGGGMRRDGGEGLPCALPQPPIRVGPRRRATHRTQALSIHASQARACKRASRHEITAWRGGRRMHECAADSAAGRTASSLGRTRHIHDMAEKDRGCGGGREGVKAESALPLPLPPRCSPLPCGTVAARQRREGHRERGNRGARSGRRWAR